MWALSAAKGLALKCRSALSMGCDRSSSQSEDFLHHFADALQFLRATASLIVPLVVWRKALALLSLLLTLGATCAAQIPSVTDTTSTPVPNAGHDYIGALNETVNPANGSLSIRIGVPVPPSRGFTLPFNFAYDSNGTYYLHSPCQGCNGIAWWTTNSMLSQGGWSYSVPMLSVQSSSFTMQTVSPTDVAGTFICQVRDNFVMQDMSGNRRNLGLSYFNSNDVCSAAEGGPDNEVLSAQEGSLLSQTTGYWASQMSNGAGAVNPLTVTDGDGTVYSFGSGVAPPLSPLCGPACGPTTYPASGISDRNGNTVGISFSKIPNSPALTYTDTIGRTALSIPTFGANPDSVTVSGLAAPYKVYWSNVSASFPITLTNLPAESNGTCSGPGSQPAVEGVSAIVLPNRQQYTITYDPTYGLVSKIAYPTGGYVRFTWGLNTQSEYGVWPIYSSENIGTGDAPVYQQYQSGACSYYYDTPAVTHRYVSLDGVKETLQQDFSYSTTWPPPSSWGNGAAEGTWTQKQTTVVTHVVSNPATQSLANAPQFTTVYTYSSTVADEQPNIYPPAQIPVESEVQYYDTNGALLRTVNKQWANERMLTQQTIALDNNQVSQTKWTYNTNEMETEKDDYDYGSGAPGAILRKTLIPSYASFSTHIVDKPSSVLVESGGNAFFAGVGYTYDAVGNLLSRADWLNSNGSPAVTTSHTYDAYGDMLTTTDPRQNTTTYTYGPSPFYDSCSFTTPASSYLTSIAYPSTNGVSHTDSFQYYCASGDLYSSTDENSQTSTYQYSDPLGRLTQTTRPDGGQTSINYGGNTIPEVITTTTVATPSPTQTSSKTLDGMGHVTAEVLPSGATILTTYDGLGRTYTATNPYFTSSDATYGTTTYNYDALGRKTSQVQQDNASILYWCYDGVATQGQPNCLASKSVNYTGRSWVDSSDENGVHWQHVSDGLGRMVSALEPNTGNTPALESDYAYDPLGNLLSVNQTGVAGETARSRSFSYDALSRLLSANNPETGLICYGVSSTAGCNNGADGYDGNGNLIGKTDARGITTTFSYDALNRLIAKAYSDGTPSSCYQYDSAAIGVGRLGNEWTQTGSCPTPVVVPGSGFLTLRSISSYDAMGRVLSEQQCTPNAAGAGNCTTSSPNPFALSYVYDLAGNAMSYTNGVNTVPVVGSITFGLQYDGAGRLQTLNSSWNPLTNLSSAPITLFTADPSSGYTPAGAIQNMVLGDNIFVNKTYDRRLRVTGETATHP